MAMAIDVEDVGKGVATSQLDVGTCLVSDIHVHSSANYIIKFEANPHPYKYLIFV